MGRSEFDERDIHLALDGELPPEDAAAFQAWLEANPEMRMLRARYASDRALLHQALGEIAQEDPPARLKNGTRWSPPRAFGPSGTLLRFTAAALLLVLGAAGGYFAGRPPAAADGDLTTLAVVGQAVAAHEVYAAEKLHVVEVGASDRNHLVSWLSNRLGISLIAPDLGKEGFSLVGGRLLPSGDKPAAQLMYEDESGGRVSLYVAHCVADEDSGFRLFERNGARAFYWHEKSFAYAVAGAASEERLLKLADATYRQLLQKN